MDEHGEGLVPIAAEVVDGVDDVGSLGKTGEQQARAVNRYMTAAWTRAVGVAPHGFDREHTLVAASSFVTLTGLPSTVTDIERKLVSKPDRAHCVSA